MKIKTAIRIFIATLFLLLCPAFSSCKAGVDYFSYVSEYRKNIFLGGNDALSVKIYAMERESPYAMDGRKKTVLPRTEIHLTAPSGEKEYTVSFQVDQKKYGGDLSFDNVKAEYFFNVQLDVSSEKEIELTFVCGTETNKITAKSVLTENVVSAKTALSMLTKTETDFFSSLTTKNGFQGEIYLRLIYENEPYYYVGVIDRKGKITAYLLSAKTGKILAKRES